MEYKGDIYYIGEVLKGKSNAYSHIVERHKDNVFNLAFRICGNREEAEEVAQDSFLKAFRSLNGFRMKSRFSTWLYRIVYNTSISYLRSKKRGMLSIDEYPATVKDFIAPGTPEEEAESKYRESLVNFALQKISDDERTLVTLYYYDELSNEEISEIMDISKSNIKVRLFRARKRICEIIEKIEKNNLVCHE